MTTFELEANSKHPHIYGIRLYNGRCLWYNTREDRDEAFLNLQ